MCENGIVLEMVVPIVEKKSFSELAISVVLDESVPLMLSSVIDELAVLRLAASLSSCQVLFGSFRD